MANTDFIITTDAAPDKIEEIIEGSFTAAARYGVYQHRRTAHTVPISLDNDCLPEGWFRIGSSGWYKMGVSTMDTSVSPPIMDAVQVNAYMTRTQLTVVCSNVLASAQTITFKVRAITNE